MKKTFVTKLKEYFVFFPFSIFFIILFFNNLNENNPQIITDGLERLSLDLAKIGSATQITNFTVLVIIISLFINFFVLLNYKNFVETQIDLVSYFYVFLRLFFSIVFSIIFTMYLFRIYVNRPRLLIYTTIFTIFIFSFNFFAKKILKQKIIANIFIVFLSFLSFLYLFNSSYSNLFEIEAQVSSEQVSDIYVGKSTEDLECFEWYGSRHDIQCLSGAYIEDVQYFPNPINNVIKFKNNYYYIGVDGIIYINSPDEIFLNIESEVRSRNEIEEPSENGLFGLAFHPTESSFITSYSDMKNNLVFKKFLMNASGSPVNENSEIVFSVPSSVTSHFGGNIIWSNHFNDFILSVGDMDQAHPIYSFYNHEPIDTTSPRGKLLLLNSKRPNPYLLSSTNLNLPRKDIIGYGLRNPWQTLEYDGYLFVPDIGLGVEEELNVINLKDLKDQTQIFLAGLILKGV